MSGQGAAVREAHPESPSEMSTRGRGECRGCRGGLGVQERVGACWPRASISEGRKGGKERPRVGSWDVVVFIPEERDQ